MIGYRRAPGELGHARGIVEQSPMAADSAFERALPWFIERFDHVDVEFLAARQRQHVLDHARLVRRRRQRALAHASGARPANLADDDLLAGKGRHQPAADLRQMGGGLSRWNWKILPIGQDMDGDEVGSVGDIPVAQPEFPHVGISHRRGHARLHRADGLDELGCRHFPAQQHLVADHNRADGAGIGLGQGNRGLDLKPVLFGVTRQPEPLHDLETVARSDPGDLVQPVVDRIGPHAVGQPRQLRQILLDLGGGNSGCGVERALAAPERGIGQAVELFTGSERGLRHRHSGTEPGPDRGYDHR